MVDHTNIIRSTDERVDKLSTPTKIPHSFIDILYKSAYDQGKTNVLIKQKIRGLFSF
jgi:hypothetical protein